jgi:hypothetical protein
MPGQFVEGVWVEKPVIDRLRDEMFQAAALHHDEYNQVHKTQCTVTWLTSSQGHLVVYASDKQYAEKIRRFVERLK